MKPDNLIERQTDRQTDTYAKSERETERDRERMSKSYRKIKHTDVSRVQSKRI